MNLYMPVPVYSEENAVRNHERELAGLGQKALIVTGQHSSRINGALQDTLDALQAFDRPYVIFDAVEENPSVATVARAAAFGREEAADFVIGVGGGSPLDAAKAIAFLMAQPLCDNPAELLYTPCSDEHLPLALIPTTCGTGSEATQYSVLTLPERQTKKSISHAIFGQIALIDGRYLSSAPLSVLRNTALDALAHLFESYLNVKANDFSKAFVAGGLSLWRQNRSVLEDGISTAEQRQGLMNASALAGMAIAQTSTSLPHGLSYALTIHLHMPHGQAVGYFLSGFLAAAPASDRQYLLEQAGFADLEAFRQWYSRLYCPPAVPAALLCQNAEALWQNQPKVRTASFPVDKETLFGISNLQ